MPGAQKSGQIRNQHEPHPPWVQKLNNKELWLEATQHCAGCFLDLKSYFLRKESVKPESPIPKLGMLAYIPTIPVSEGLLQTPALTT